MDLKPGVEAIDFLQNGIFLQTSTGIVCLTIKDASNLNLSVEDLKAVTEKLILQEPHTNTTKEVQHFLSDATVDSDEPYSDCGTAITAQPSLLARTDSDFETINITPPSRTPEATFYNVSDSDASSIIARSSSDGAIINVSTNAATSDTGTETNELPAKRRGGWPKGRKRKPELLHLPPKAPSTGYNLYLNDIRKQFKNSSLAFHEVTKIIGNKWSSLSMDEKKPYLERAEEDKRRYKEELRVYRQSSAYQLYMAKKRRKRVQQNNVLSESDMDAADDIDDEDNEELYCKTCDQWFHNLHNKREHLQGRQHMQAMVGDMHSELGPAYYKNGSGKANCVSFSTSLDESSLEANPALAIANIASTTISEGTSVSESMINLFSVVIKRENEMKTLKNRLEEAKAAHDALYQQLRSLKEREATLKDELKSLQNVESMVETKLFKLWQVPSLFVTTDLNSVDLESSEYSPNEIN